MKPVRVHASVNFYQSFYILKRQNFLIYFFWIIYFILYLCFLLFDRFDKSSIFDSKICDALFREIQ